MIDLRRSTTQLSRLAAASAVTALLAFTACSSVPDFGVNLQTTPTAPIPDKPIGLKVTLSGADSSAAQVAVKLAGKTLKLSRADDGSFTSDELVLPGEGEHAVTVLVTVDGETAEYTASLSATCTTNGGVGAACCAADACGKGLTCVFGACAAAPAPTAGKCHAASECQSGICGDNACTAPSCTDKIKNGGEANVDCGGSCGGCLTGASCTLDKDCAAGVCAQGVCPLNAGKLIGVGSSPSDTAGNTAKITTILNESLIAPSDLAFSTLDPNQLWVVDTPTDSFVVIFGPGKEGQSHSVRKDYSEHFMEHVMAISFSSGAFFGTCGDSRNDYNNQAAPNNFMGPVQWPSDFNAYPATKSAHKVHADMLHSSPNCMGIAATSESSYYAFNGYNGSIDWVDFHEPHCPGCDDHSDGVKRRFDGLKVKRVANLPSNLRFDPKTSWLYITDSGNGRVLRIDTRNSYEIKKIPAFLNDGTLSLYSKPVVQELKASGLKNPSGLAFDRGVLYVGDAATGVISAWKLTAQGEGDTFGTLIASLKTGFAPGSLVGITVGPDRKLYAIDRGGKRVVRVDP